MLEEPVHWGCSWVLPLPLSYAGAQSLPREGDTHVASRDHKEKIAMKASGGGGVAGEMLSG